MNKKIIIGIMFLTFFIYNQNVFAGSFDVKLDSNVLNVEKNSKAEINISLSNINGITNGLNACQVILKTDSTIKIDTVSGLNNWSVTNGANLILDTTTGVSNNTSIAKITANIEDNGMIYLSDISCTNGDMEYYTTNTNIEFKVKEMSNNIIENTTTTTTSISSSETTNNPKTGLYNIFIILVTIFFVSFISLKIIKNRDLFKKI